jgi:predicted GTPase
MQEQIKEWLAVNSKVKILITGKMGTGKTTLVKGLKEQFVPEGDHLEPHTLKVTPYEHEYGQIEFTFYDTPGLKDTINGSNDYSYLKDMVRNSEKPDLIIFTLKMDDTQFREEDQDAIGNITDAFGLTVWKNAMFILTFANKVQKFGHDIDSRENTGYYSELVDKFALNVTELLLKLEVQEDIANNIPVIPVGLISQPKIGSDKRDISWLEEFWQTLFTVLKRTPGRAQ